MEQVFGLDRGLIGLRLRCCGNDRYQPPTIKILRRTKVARCDALKSRLEWPTGLRRRPIWPNGEEHLIVQQEKSFDDKESAHGCKESSQKN